MVYSNESGVYNTTGFSSDIIQKLASISPSEVTTLVSGWISDAEAQIKMDIDIPYVIREELHLGDGENNYFELGPRDESYGIIGADYDPTNCVEKVYDVKFHRVRMKKPYPEDCELGTEQSTTTNWTSSSCTVSSDLTSKVAGSYCIKGIFTGSGYMQYQSTLDKIIDQFTDIFFWFKASTKSVTFKIQIFDENGNYAEETITPRQANVGQYFWIDIDTMDLVGSVDWDSYRVQYYRITASGACTVYVDNLCFADSWAFTAPLGYVHTSVADNISSETPPSENYPFYVTYEFDPFKASVPTVIRKACEWLVGVFIIDYLRGIKYMETDFRLFGDTIEPDTPMQKSGMLGIRTKFLDNYETCLKRYGGESYGVV